MIDLLSVLISFLLMSAVWTQIARIEVKQAPNVPSDEIPPPEEKEKLELTVVISTSGYTITQKRGEVIREIEKGDDGYNTNALREVLKQVVVEFPDNEDVTVASEDNIPYEELITVMDICLDSNLPGIAIAGRES
ncbi:MAG: biopolymer transporter ExbD [Myxococcales bacterium]|nr:biopolymer transporter ExbD [Myxococcales bacterium]